MTEPLPKDKQHQGVYSSVPRDSHADDQKTTEIMNWIVAPLRGLGLSLNEDPVWASIERSLEQARRGPVVPPLDLDPNLSPDFRKPLGM